MAFLVRKRRQIGHLALLLLWLRTRRSGVQISQGAPLTPSASFTYATCLFSVFRRRTQCHESDGTADHGFPISTYYIIKDAGNAGEFLWQKTSRA